VRGVRTFATSPDLDVDRRAMMIRADQGTVRRLPTGYLDA
jgi:hypothetical protein